MPFASIRCLGLANIRVMVKFDAHIVRWLWYCLKWHPDRCSKDPKFALEAKKQFQHVQEAYSVLSNTGKRRIYDAGLFGLIGEDDDEGFVDFMQEMILMMQNVRPKDEKGTMEDLQGLLRDMMMKENEGIGNPGFSCNSTPCPTKRTRIS
ncbi:uncharacterized protein LOC108328713 isoform X2 [Vigna angularis]|uniref:uncharacterized protein LOC108328713 isoform X2 n=1 Tax=Phaseolus angularis TaxID=3914 RepID=UPI000809C375|nr:uncharacterized protein LOC108328713 isoform X2 [Vigna angularis]